MSNDTRSKREKLLALINDRGATDGEREAARRALERLDGSRGNPKSPGLISREDVEAAPDETRARGTLRFQNSSGTWVEMDAEFTFTTDFTAADTVRTYGFKARKGTETYACSQCTYRAKTIKDAVAHDCPGYNPAG